MTNSLNELYEYYSEFDTDDDPIDAVIEGVNHDNKLGLADYLGISMDMLDNIIEYRDNLVDKTEEDTIKLIKDLFDIDLVDVEDDFFQIW